jgi:DNA-directed RNA polymerase subunit RPC12/RpoP
VSRNNQNVCEKDARVELVNCPHCNHKHMWGSRSKTGQGFYIRKCTKCGYMVR